MRVETGYASIATALWLDGRPSGAGILARVNQALNSLRGRTISPVLAVVTYSGSQSLNDAQRAMSGFLPRTGPLAESVKKWVVSR